MVLQISVISNIVVNARNDNTFKPLFSRLSRRSLWGGVTELAALYELLGVLLASFGLNLIPFAGPSNLMIAAGSATLVNADPFTIGFMVAFGSASAKFIHYLVTFFVGGLLGKERRRHLDDMALKLRRWAFVALFIVAATPLPDEPVVIPLGLIKYNPFKFYLSYFLGKLSIAIIGAYLGLLGKQFLSQWVNPEILNIASIVASVILTIVVTVVLLKIDVQKVAERIFEKGKVED
jgi:membrane protein DedA with SNARE-associated domain